VLRVLDFLCEDSDGVDTIQLVLQHLDLLTGEERQLFQFFLVLLWPAADISKVLLQLLFGLLDPIKKRFFDEDLARVQDKTFTFAKGVHRMNHSLLVGAFKGVWGNHTFDLLSKTERHEFWNDQLHAAAESDSKIDSKDLTIGCVNQEVFKMTITDADQVRCDREDCHRFDELVLDCDER